MPDDTSSPLPHFVKRRTEERLVDPKSTTSTTTPLPLLVFSAGGVRLDAADSYGDEVSTAQGARDANRSRDSVWFTSKVGPGGYAFPLGYEDAKAQVVEILHNYSTTYLDLLLIHQPVPHLPFVVPVVDQYCNPNNVTMYNETTCRLRTWRALVEVCERI